MQSYRAVIVGAGQGGSPLAKALAEAGWQVALVERKFVGGTCINTGCTPTKTMIASAKVAHLARRGEDYGVKVESVRVDMQRVRERQREIVERFRASSEKGLEQQDNLTFIRGHAHFLGPKTLRVEGEGETLELAADTIILDVGQRPRVPELAGLEELPYLTSSSILDLAEVPEHLIILGGGYIGLEFAQMFRRFGSEVTVVQHGAQLLPREDKDVAEALRELLEEDGVRVLLNAEAKRVLGKNGGLTITLKMQEGDETLSGSHLLIATGRTPNTDDLGLSAAGVEMDEQGYIRVDERFRTSAEGVYAIGDATGGPAFTHISYDDYRILKNRLLGGERLSKAGRLVPYALFTDPQLGRVGLSEGEAKEQGLDYQVAKLPMSSVARALETGETRGFMKVLVEPDSGKLLGVAILGLEGGELMSALQIAMMGGLSYTALRDGTFAHPTLVESFNNLFAGLE